MGIYWTFTENIILRFRNRQNSVYMFASFVNKALVLCTHSNIGKFSLDFNYHRRFVYYVNLWVRFAMQKGVKELDLNLYSFRPGHHYKLPKCVFENLALEKLSLSKCKLNGAIGWKFLRVLVIKCAEITPRVVQTIMKGCPALEFLELYRCWVECYSVKSSRGKHRLNFNSSSLKKLVIRGYRHPRYGGGDKAVKISAPNVLSLEISVYLRYKKFVLGNVLSLLNAKLDFIQDASFKAKEKMLKSFLDKLDHFKDITIGSWCIQVLSALEVNGYQSPLSVRKCLTVVSKMEHCNLPGIVNVVRSSPDLETLVINMDFDSDKFSFASNLSLSTMIKIATGHHRRKFSNVCCCIERLLKSSA